MKKESSIDVINNESSNAYDPIGEEDFREFTVNDAVEHCGNGLYQVGLLFLCGICWLVDSMEIMLIGFLLPVLQQEWALKGWQKGLLGSLIFVGMFLGASIFGWLSDKMGRRKALSIFVVYTGVTGAVSAFAPNWILFMFCRFLTGIGCAGAHVPFSLFSEFLPTRGRGYYLLAIELFWTFGAMAEAGLAWIILPRYVIHFGSYTVRSWRLLLLLTSTPLFFTILMLPFIPESPRYLMLKGKKQKALETLQSMAKWNCVPMIQGNLVAMKREDRLARKEAPKQNKSFLLIFSKKYAVTTIALSVLWFVCSFAYYGVVVLTPDYFRSKGSGDNSYLEVFITSSAELPGVFLALVLINSVGRRWTLGITFLLCGVFLFTLLIPGSTILLTLFAVMSRLSVMGAFSTIYVVTPELYPTVVRAFGVGFNSSVARIAGILTPFISSALFAVSPRIPVVIYAVSSFVGVVAVLFIQETNGKQLSETDDDEKVPDKKMIQPDAPQTEQTIQ